MVFGVTSKLAGQMLFWTIGLIQIQVYVDLKLNVIGFCLMCLNVHKIVVVAGSRGP